MTDTTWRESSIADRCANLQCLNRQGEGMFTLLVTSDNEIVGGHRGLSIIMCMPCARALKSITKKERQ